MLPARVLSLNGYGYRCSVTVVAVVAIAVTAVDCCWLLMWLLLFFVDVVISTMYVSSSGEQHCHCQGKAKSHAPGLSEYPSWEGPPLTSPANASFNHLMGLTTLRGCTDTLCERAIKSQYRLNFARWERCSNRSHYSCMHNCGMSPAAPQLQATFIHRTSAESAFSDPLGVWCNPATSLVVYPRRSSSVSPVSARMPLCLKACTTQSLRSSKVSPRGACVWGHHQSLPDPP